MGSDHLLQQRRAGKNKAAVDLHQAGAPLETRDFDVGKYGLGEQNFTANFSSTEEFQRLIRLGYVDIRYTDDNRFGVRFEPWHIKLT